MVFTHRVQSEPVGCYQHPAGSLAVVGRAGFEPATSAVSRQRSYQAELTAHRGGGGNRTRVQGFAGPCLSHSATPPAPTFPAGGIMALDIRRTVRAWGLRDGIRRLRADDGIRTRDPHLGKVMLYQLSHVRTPALRPMPTGTVPGVRTEL